MLKIITDSSSEIEQEEADDLGVEVIPITIVFKEGAYAEGTELRKDEFYARLTAGEFPRTAQPSPELFREAFERTGGEETLVLLISSALSGTTETARFVARDFPNVHIFDTLCTTAMLRYLVETAVKNREKSAEEVIAILGELRPRLRLRAFVDTLEYLYRGGRVKRTVAIMGDLLHIKPLIGVSSDGRIVMTGRAHGRKRAVKELADYFSAVPADPAYPVYFLQSDTDVPVREVMKLAGQEGARIFRICCAIGSHIGPNAAGVVYVAKQ